MKEGLADLPSYNAKTFSQVKPSDSLKKAKLTKYVPTHDQTVPRPDQVIGTESTNILVRQFYKLAEQKQMMAKQKRGVGLGGVDERHPKRPKP
mmetsp:Transcript_68278/g.216011  ORF Transcript_68278/g.216011 Transcript_68278/m.216011 type:complete len:93 (-) Transcript_68278:2016-2294(-)